VGLPSRREVILHEQMWRYWLSRFEEACRAVPEKKETTHP
jgi:hypothetical protein